MTPVLRALLLGAAMATLGGCSARKAPGPEECRAFALSAIGAPANLPASTLAQRPALYEQAEELTRLCLVTPYDYEVLNCAETTGRYQACLRRFQQRLLSGG